MPITQGQSSLEYVIIVGLLFVILTPLVYYAVNTSSERIKVSQAEDAVNTIATAANEVYALSPGSKKYVWVAIPGGVQLAQVSNSEVSLTISWGVGTSDIVAITKSPVLGSLPSDKGTYRISVELLPSGVVLIGEGNDTTAPIVTWKSPGGLVCNPITLRATTNEPATCRANPFDTSYEQLSLEMVGNSLGHSYNLGVQPESNYQYFVRCRDAFGNAMSESALINYSINFITCSQGPVIINETIPPVAHLISPAPGFVSNSSRVNFYYNVTDDSAILLCRLLANNSVIASIPDPVRNIANNITGNLDLGKYNWSVNCTDFFGNQGASEQRLIMINATWDQDQPVVKLVSPANGSIRSFNLVQFFYNVSDATSTISFCTLSVTSFFDGGGNSKQELTDFSVTKNSLESFSLSLNKGNHTWEVSCTDASIYQNRGRSPTWWLRINVSSEETFIVSCGGQCELAGYSNGVCRQEPPKCLSNGEIYGPEGDKFCIGGSQSDTCCCQP